VDASTREVLDKESMKDMVNTNGPMAISIEDNTTKENAADSVHLK